MLLCVQTDWNIPEICVVKEVIMSRSQVKRQIDELSDSSPEKTPLTKKHYPSLSPHCEDIDKSLIYHPPTKDNMSSTETPDWAMFWSALQEIKSDVQGIQGIRQDIGDMKKDLSDLKSSYSMMEDSLKQTQSKADDALQKATDLENCVQKLSDENSQLREKLLVQESYSRKYNLKFFNVPEDQSENTDSLLNKIGGILRIMDLDLSKMYIDNIHRLPQGNRKPKPIIVKFVSYLDRELVWRNRGKLAQKGTKFFIQDHYPPEAEEKIRMLLPIMKAAKLQNMRAKIIGDKLKINSTTYTVNSLHLLPESLKGVNSSVRKEDGHLLFFTGKCPLSNFFPSKFSIKMVEYSCAEQFLQKMKADLFRDTSAGRDIMNAKTPQAMKAIGHKVQGFSEEEWERQAPDLVRPGLEAKFRQHAESKQYLLESGDLQLVEASYDKFWGNGHSFYDKKIMDKKDEWTNNHLGRMLMEIRDGLP